MIRRYGLTWGEGELDDAEHFARLEDDRLRDRRRGIVDDEDDDDRPARRAEHGRAA